MFAIAFDLRVDELKEHYGEPYNKAYDDIRAELESLGFKRAQGGIYMSQEQNNTLSSVYKAIDKLSSIEWFKKSVRDIRAFKVEDWSDFTEIIKGE